MKTGKKIILGLAAFMLIGLMPSCASNDPAKVSHENERGIIESAFMAILEGLTESTQEAREIQRQLTLEQQQAFLERHSEAAADDPGLQSVKEAEGVGGKLAQILTNIKEHTKTVQEKGQARREEINEQTAAVNPYIRARQEIQENGKSD